MKVGLSFSEIYMDEIYDMLDFENDKKLAIREHQTTKEPYVENQILITINSASSTRRAPALSRRPTGERSERRNTTDGCVSILLPLYSNVPYIESSHEALRNRSLPSGDRCFNRTASNGHTTSLHDRLHRRRLRDPQAGREFPGAARAGQRGSVPDIAVQHGDQRSED